MNAISLTGVTAAYDGTTVLDDVQLAVPSGAWLGIVGPNGAGKTTLLRAIAGAVPSRGAITIGSEDARGLDARARAASVAYLPQRPALPDGMSVSDYVFLGRTPHLGYFGSEGPRDRQVVAQVLRRLELEPFAERELASLSGGELQRVLLARALAQQAPIVLLDEPTSALDVGHQQQVLELLDRLRTDDGLTIVSAMHDLTLAGQFADRLVLLSRGRIAAQGTPPEVLTEPLIAAHFGAEVRVVRAPDRGLVVVPTRAARLSASLEEPA